MVLIPLFQADQEPERNWQKYYIGSTNNTAK